MTIRASATREVDALLAHLSGASPVERDAAIARLRIIGTRAVGRVLPLLDDTSQPAVTRCAALAVLDGLDEPRVRRAVLHAATDTDIAVACGALQLASQWLLDTSDTTPLETLVALASDLGRPEPVRRAAVDALSRLPAATVAPVVAVASVANTDAPPTHDPAALLDWLSAHPDAAPGALHDVLAHARDQESAVPQQAPEWRAVRVTAHTALANRGSRLGLDDLRELFSKSSGPLHMDLLGAIAAVGDLSCLDALGHAFDAAPDDGWWREQVSATIAAVMHREKATRRHAAVKRLLLRHPQAVRTRP